MCVCLDFYRDLRFDRRKMKVSLVDLREKDRGHG